MPKLTECFPSEYLAAKDLEPGRRYTLTVESAALELIQDGERKESKPVVAFVGADKRLILNVTRTNALVAAFGDVELADLAGKRVVVQRGTRGSRRVPQPLPTHRDGRRPRARILRRRSRLPQRSPGGRRWRRRTNGPRSARLPRPQRTRSPRPPPG